MDQVLAHVSSRVLVVEHGTVRRDSHGISFTAGSTTRLHDRKLRPVVHEHVEGVEAHVLENHLLVHVLIAVLDEVAMVLVLLVGEL